MTTEIVRCVEVARECDLANRENGQPFAFDEDQMVEYLREHFIDAAPTPRFLVVLTGPSETLYGHTIAGFGLRMGFLEAHDYYYDKVGNIGTQYKLTTKGKNILDIGTMLRTGDWPEVGSEPPKRIINVRRLA